jgi:ATP-dependent DNA helicase RecQ
VHGRFGLGAAAQLLRGGEDPRLSRMGLERSKTFGALRDHSEEWLTRLLRRCVTAGWVDFHGGERPVVVLTEEGEAVMRGLHPARLLLPTSASAGRRRTSGTAPSSTPARRAASGDAPDAGTQVLFEALRRYRLGLARAEGVPPYVVASDRCLREIARLRPSSEDELMLAYGIGPAKLKRYGAGLLAVVAEHARPRP